MELPLTLLTVIAVRAIILWLPAVITAIVILRRQENRPLRVLSIAMIVGVLLDVAYHALVIIIAFPRQGVEGS